MRSSSDPAPTSYNEAQAELQAILRKLQNEDSDLDAMATQVQRARYLLDWSRARLRATEQAVDELLSATAE